MIRLALLFVTLFSLNLHSQSVDEELGFVYVKAEYLMETNRYEEAIKEFTTIIAKEPAFRDAMYKRAEAKFYVGAFQGTYNDLLQVFELKGITPEAILLFGKAQKNLGKTDQAATTMETAEILFPNGTSARDKSNRSRDNTQEESTTEDRDPLDELKDKISSVLDDLLPDNEDDAGNESDTNTDDSPRTGTDRNSGDDNTSGDRSRTSAEEIDLKNERNSEPVEVEPEVDDSVNEIFIDEDVTLEIKNGLGSRKILQQPTILILSETTGNVVVDLCVNGNGKVTEAEYNGAESTLKTQSIISLAVRKSKEFWFKSSSSNEMCGTIVFKITGSN